MRPKVRLRSSVSRVALGAFGCLAASLSWPASAAVQPLPINVEESIIWSTPSPFAGETLTASSLFESGSFSDDQFQPTGSFGAHDYLILYPPNPAFPPNPVEIFLPAVQINWGDSITWKLTGTIGAAVASFLATACSAGLFEPPDPCLSVTIGVDLVGGFAPIDLSGGIFAFDSPLQIGTWEIKVAEVPEPSTFALVGIGVASLAAFLSQAGRLRRLNGLAVARRPS